MTHTYLQKNYFKNALPFLYTCLYEAHSVVLSLRCEIKKYNTDIRRMYHISSNKSPGWFAPSLSCFCRQSFSQSYVLVSFWVYPSYTEVQQIWSYIGIVITCLKELLWTLEIIRTHKMQDIVIIMYVAARKVCVVVDSKVKNLSYTLSYKYCHKTLIFIRHNFGIILTIFEKFKYYFEFDKSAISRLQPSRNEEL